MKLEKRLETPISSKLSQISVSAILLSIFLSISGAKAQDWASANETLPSLDKSAELPLPDEREISIHKSAGTKELTRAVYFHRPVFAFIENTNNEDGESFGHTLFWDKETLDGEVYILFKTRLSSPQIRELARTAVIEQDVELQTSRNPEFSDLDVEVRPWPIKLLRLEVKRRLVSSTYGDGTTDTLRSSGDDIEIVLKVPESTYPEFLEALKGNRVNFHPSYTYDNVIVAFGQTSQAVSGEISTAINNVLTSAQIERGGVIGQDDAANISETLRQSITTTIRATDPNVLAHIKPQDVAKLVIQPKKIEFRNLVGNSDLVNSVDSYLEPLKRDLKQIEEESNSATDATESNQSEEITLKLKGSYGFASGSGEIKMTDEQKRKLENEHKVGFRKVEKSEEYELHYIEVSFVRDLWQENLVTTFQDIYLATGRDDSFQNDSPFRASFTVAELDDASEANDIVFSPNALVPRGVPMCSVRSNVPKGFVLLDGQGLFPNENWVASDLRGNSLPDMRGKFLRGAQIEEQSGTLVSDSSITIPSSSVPASSFQIQGAGSAGAFGQAREIYRYNAEYQPVFDSASSPPTGFYLRSGSTGGGLFYDAGEKVNGKPEHASIVGISTSYTLSGSHTIPDRIVDLSLPANQPPHFNCQWIMRVR